MISTYLELCVQHLTGSTNALLDDLAEQMRKTDWAPEGWPYFNVGLYAEGRFVTVPEQDLNKPDNLANLPADLADVFRYARTFGITLLRFDYEGPIVQALPYYSIYGDIDQLRAKAKARYENSNILIEDRAIVETDLSGDWWVEARVRVADAPATEPPNNKD